MKKLFLFLFAIVIAGLIAYYFWPENTLGKGHKITRLVVYKSKRLLNIFAGDTLLKSYTISLGDDPIGDKSFQGDEKTPEGQYSIFDKNPNSTCYKNLGISYPNDSDRKVSKALGKPTGGDIKIHGLPNKQGYWGKFHRFIDWTNGCIAVTNEEMDELYYGVDIGTPITINP